MVGRNLGKMPWPDSSPTLFGQMLHLPPLACQALSLSFRQTSWYVLVYKPKLGRLTQVTSSGIRLRNYFTRTLRFAFRLRRQTLQKGSATQRPLCPVCGIFSFLDRFLMRCSLKPFPTEPSKKEQHKSVEWF